VVESSGFYGSKGAFGVHHPNQKCWMKPCPREVTDDRFRDRRSQLWMTDMGAKRPWHSSAVSGMAALEQTCRIADCSSVLFAMYTDQLVWG
jgi:hypothetical protein